MSFKLAEFRANRAKHPGIDSANLESKPGVSWTVSRKVGILCAGAGFPSRPQMPAITIVERVEN